jgi:adenine-specific DNA-methyltransferase
MARSKAKKRPTHKSSAKVDSIRHADTRKNIPTEELRDFVADEESAPAQMLYPRDPSLDPQLVWKGKDDQDRKDLAVPVVPIYIQEKVHPQAIIEDLLARYPKAGVKEPNAAYNQTDLFADFNGLPEEFDQRVDFYEHEAHWQNRFILGDSLMVMTSLAEKEGLKGKVQCIYFDPPYGIKFGSNWQVSTRKRDVKDGKAEDATRQPEQIRAFRDTWTLGIHSYLSYMRDRLVTARELLTETGSIFVQISDENIHLVRSLLDEVFGSANFCRLITFAKTSGQTDNLLASVSDYLIWYAKDRTRVKFRQVYLDKVLGGAGSGAYRRVQLADGTRRPATKEELDEVVALPDGARLYRLDNLTSQSPGTRYPVKLAGKTYTPKGYWKTEESLMPRLINARRVEAGGEENLYYVRFLDDFSAYPVNDSWTDTVIAGFASDKKYVVETSTKVVERCLVMCTDPGDLVLDPTCGSGTTAYVAEQWGRRWITIDTSRVALALARTRLMAGRLPYYLLADTPEGVAKEAELSGRAPAAQATGGDIKRGFVYRRVPHIKLKDIANNPDIKAGMSQGQIDEAIARHAGHERLYDQPYEDKKRVRVAGPFTVESLSPHRVLQADVERPTTERRAERESGDFALMILDNLSKAGVQNTKKNERLVFEALNAHGGAWIHATGEYKEGGKTRRAAVSIGPEHGTVGPQQVKEAAKEAVQGVGFDLLVVCGFAFDPHVSEEVKRYGKLTVLPVKMNPDLALGDELLKKTGAGNLFMVFGEPDIGPINDKGKLTPQKDGNYIVRINGLDIYDPTTGQIRSSTTDDIACWFLDTEYNGESFFVRHAYFTGADEPYEKLKRALKAEIDEEGWKALYSTVSQPFPRPATGKIAIKVINHYGDEVLRVIPV